MARLRGFPQVRRAKRKTGWDVGPGGLGSTTFGATASIIVGSGISPTVDGLTLIRLRGTLTWLLTSAGAITDRLEMYFGIGVVQSPAFAVGVTAVPTPLTEQSWDGWLFWKNWSSSGIANSAAGAPKIFTMDVDTKAMRKLTTESTVYAVGEAVETGGASGLLSFDSRVLFKLP